MKVAIIGGGAAGMSAASRVKAIRPDWDVIVFEKSQFVSHAPCGIPFYISGYVEHFKDLCTYSVEFFKYERNIDVKNNTRVVEVGENYLVAEDKEKTYEYEWDRLLFATGARAEKIGADGENLEGIFHVDIERAQKIKKSIVKAENIVIIGSGYIGVEMTEAVLKLGKKPTIIEMQERPLPEYDAEIAAILKVEMEKYVNLKLSESVIAFEGKDKVEKVITDKGEYKCDLAIVAIGVRPNTEIARKIVKLGKMDSIKTDSRMKTSRENVFAAGDCAETTNVVTGKPDWIPLAAPANKMGYVAGVNMAEKDLEYPGSLKSQITSFFELEIGKAGLSEHEAIREGFEVVSAFISSRTAARYLPDGGLIHLKVVADRNGKLLGVQAMGKGVVPRIFAASVLLYKRCTVQDMFFADFPYYPLISRVWDPLVIAARNLFRKVGLS